MAENSPQPHCLCEVSVCVYAFVCVYVCVSDQSGQGDSCPMWISCVCLKCACPVALS